jgi:hypothetical protein
VVATVLGLIVLTIIVLRMVRRRHKNPRYIPTSFLKKRWQGWTPSSAAYRSNNGQPQDTSYDTVQGARRRSQVPPSNPDAAVEEVNGALGGAGVDRNTSVRSVMTLPAYNPKPLAHEQVLGREGERGGIDTVVEFPETSEEQEARREEEMESLYQVRLARRNEAAEREERRRLRREARERNDWVALQELRNRTREEDSNNTQRSVDLLRAEHERLRGRQRNVSAVSYADLGLARHDGTRIRANSDESERIGLLGDAASIAASSRYHGRHQSSSSLDSNSSEPGQPSPAFTLTQTNSRPESPLRVQVGDSNAADSSPELVEAGMGLEDIPINSPPGYDHDIFGEEPPEYVSPTTPFRERFPSLAERASAGNNASGTMDDEAAAPSEAARRASAILGPETAQASSPQQQQRTGRGVGGVPQLPSLRLSTLPTIVVEGSSPIS